MFQNKDDQHPCVILTNLCIAASAPLQWGHQLDTSELRLCLIALSSPPQAHAFQELLHSQLITQQARDTASQASLLQLAISSM